MKLKILFDYRSKQNDLHIGWGLSVLVNETVLFDTGENGEWLLENMEQLNVEPRNITSVVISHDHWDHTGGLWHLLENNSQIKVYGCKGFSNSFKEKVENFNTDFVEVPSIKKDKKEFEIFNNIYSSGEIVGKYQGSSIAEQALVLKLDKEFQKIAVITGCAHPGIENMVQKIKNKFESNIIYLVMGGFHLMNTNDRKVKLIADKFKDLNVQRVGPTHCSGRKAEEIFKQEYKEDYLEIKVARNIKF